MRASGPSDCIQLFPYWALPAYPLGLSLSLHKHLLTFPQCLLNGTVGLNCPLAQAVMTPVAGGHVSHYIGILRSLTSGRLLPGWLTNSVLSRWLLPML